MIDIKDLDDKFWYQNAIEKQIYEQRRRQDDRESKHKDRLRDVPRHLHGVDRGW